MLNFCNDYYTLTTGLGPQAGWGGYSLGHAVEVPTEEKISLCPRIWDNRLLFSRKYTLIQFKIKLTLIIHLTGYGNLPHHKLEAS